MSRDHADMTSTPHAEQIQERLERVEARLARLEEYLGLEPEATTSGVARASSKDSLEWSVGRAVFARLGVVLLSLGIVFLVALPHVDLPLWAPSMGGAALAAVAYAVSVRLRCRYPLLGSYLRGGSLLLGWFSVLRLGRFGAEPVIADPVVLGSLLLLVATASMLLAARWSSRGTAALVTCVAFGSALLGENAWFVLAGEVAATCAAVGMV